MAISKIILNGVTQMDVTGVSVQASNLIAPNTAIGADGEQVTGTATQGITPSGTLNITENGTHDVTNYASAVVNVPSSGASSWTKVAETSYQVSTTSTSAATVATWATGHSELWTSNKWIYVRIRDSAGKRDGYFYGSDQFFYNVNLVNGTDSTSTTAALRNTIRISSNNFSVYPSTATTGYGVWADTLYSDGRIRIRKRYNSSYSLTVDGTYKVEVYLLDPPTGAPIFT